MNVTIRKGTFVSGPAKFAKEDKRLALFVSCFRLETNAAPIVPPRAEQIQFTIVRVTLFVALSNTSRATSKPNERRRAATDLILRTSPSEYRYFRCWKEGVHGCLDCQRFSRVPGEAGHRYVSVKRLPTTHTRHDDN